MMTTRLIAALVLSIGLSGLAFAVLGRVGPAEIPFDDVARVASGKALYTEHCASCHGVDLAGEPNWEIRTADGYLPAPPQDERGHSWSHPDVLLFDLVKRGPEEVVGSGYKSRMPGFDEVLSDAEILSTLAYVKSTWPLAILELHELVNGRPAPSGVSLEELEACGISLGVLEAQNAAGLLPG